jgi:hypothetical protein
VLVRVYFYKEDGAHLMKNLVKISRVALDTVYELVWEMEFKNVLNPGRIWLKFKEEDNPFGIPLKSNRGHRKVTTGDIIQIVKEYYLVVDVGVKKINVVDD